MGDQTTNSHGSNQGRRIGQFRFAAIPLGLGADILAKQTIAKWGDGLLPQPSRDLIAEFPAIKGFSKMNLELIRPTVPVL